MPFPYMLPTARCFRSLDLRFSGDEEINFKRSLEPHLLRGSFVFFSIEAILTLFTVVQGYAREASVADNPFQWSHPDPRMQTFIVTAVCGVSSVTCLTFCFLRLWLCRLQNYDCELIIVVALWCQVVIIPFANNWSASLMWGINAENVWNVDPRVAEGRIVLAIDGFITATCMFLPIRSHILM